MKPRYFFSGDHHFWHKNIILDTYSDRPFRGENGDADVRLMNEHMIAEWNRVVSPGDIVCYVGNLCFGGYSKAVEILARLNGKLLYVRGIHDKKAVLRALEESGKLLAPVTYVKELEVRTQHIILSSCAFEVWPRAHHGSWNLFGYSHGSLPEKGKKMDVGVDAIAARSLGYRPVPFEYVRGILDSRKRVVPDRTH